jgi:hypothetical protein
VDFGPFGGRERGDVDGRSGFLGGEAILPGEMWTANTLVPPFRPRLRYLYYIVCGRMAERGRALQNVWTFIRICCISQVDKWDWSGL